MLFPFVSVTLTMAAELSFPPITPGGTPLVGNITMLATILGGLATGPPPPEGLPPPPPPPPHAASRSAVNIIAT